MSPIQSQPVQRYTDAEIRPSLFTIKSGALCVLALSFSLSDPFKQLELSCQPVLFVNMNAYKIDVFPSVGVVASPMVTLGCPQYTSHKSASTYFIRQLNSQKLSSPAILDSNSESVYFIA